VRGRFGGRTDDVRLAQRVAQKGNLRDRSDRRTRGVLHLLEEFQEIKAYRKHLSGRLLVKEVFHITANS
jgi:hypothetical protein